MTFARLALLPAALLGLAVLPASSQAHPPDTMKLGQRYFGADAPWFERNIPFLEIDDPELQEVYYYRWNVFRSHLREIGAGGTMETEFLPDVPWAREPFGDLNDSSAFHLMEGRWLRDPAYTNSLIDHLYTGHGNTRAFSEWIAAASERAVEVTGDRTIVNRDLPLMQRDFDAWQDHFDPSRNLYWVEPLADATEYTISSIDASGAGFETDPSTNPAKNGFTQGFAFRPSINTYQYGNALAIATVAERNGQPEVARLFRERAARLQQSTLNQIWNPSLVHFTDIYQRSTPSVQAGTFIRGRELVGYLPWLLELVPRTPEASARYDAAWRHVLSPDELLGPAGVRTVEPTYARYLTRYRFAGVRPECAWNGPSWPFQTSQMLTGMANLLDDYPRQSIVTRANYLRLLRQYTHQHYLQPGRLDLQEDYDPDRGGPIVGLERSHHYEHSTYVDLLLGGLIGIRPHADDTLEIAPLLPATGKAGEPPIRYFAVTRLRYHGHDLALFYDEAGTRYGTGRGLLVLVDGKPVYGPGPLQRILVPIPAPALAMPGAFPPEDVAVNVGVPDGPAVTASSSVSDAALREAIDGRMWFFPEIGNGWTPAGDPSRAPSWIELTLPKPRRVRAVELDFLAAGAFRAPLAVQLQFNNGSGWTDVPGQSRSPAQPVGGTPNRISFPALETSHLRLLFPATLPDTTFRLIEWKAFESAQP